jgi:hypothetical protein
MLLIGLLIVGLVHTCLISSWPVTGSSALCGAVSSTGTSPLGSTAFSAGTPPAGAPTSGSDGFGASTGVGGVASLDSLGRDASRFFSAVRKNTLIVVRRDLLGLQSAADNGECSQTGQD